MRGFCPALASFGLLVACGPASIVGEEGDGGDVGDASSESSSTTVSETSGAETSTSETSETGPTFVPVFDTASGACDPWREDCDEAEKCAPYASSGGNWDANKCVPVTGDQLPGEPCTYDGAAAGTDDCDASGMCWYVEEVDGVLQGTCVSFCTGSPDTPECPSGFYCPISGDGSVNICLPRCDPLEQDCMDDLACYWAGTEFLCVPPTQDIPLGQPCGFINDCAAGLMCIDGSIMPDCAGSACCANFCELELGDEQCASLPGTSCVPFFEAGMAPPEYEHVGVCVLP